MISPTIGRILWYNPLDSEKLFPHDQHYPAIVCHVWSDYEVSVFIINESGQPFSRKVALAQDREATLGECEWMPYQIGQAQKNAA